MPDADGNEWFAALRREGRRHSKVAPVDLIWRELENAAGAVSGTTGACLKDSALERKLVA
jgi:hypothetical protein